MTSLAALFTTLILKKPAAVDSVTVTFNNAVWRFDISMVDFEHINVFIVERYLEPCQTSITKLFAKIFKGWEPLTISLKSHFHPGCLTRSLMRLFTVTLNLDYVIWYLGKYNFFFRKLFKRHYDTPACSRSRYPYLRLWTTSLERTYYGQCF